MRPDRRNAQTQPHTPRPVHQRWDVLARAWYVVGRSASLAPGTVLGVDVGPQRLAVWRTDDGEVHAVDGFCAHMGTDLAIGRVCGAHLRCFFHHWTVDGQGRCQHAPGRTQPVGQIVTRAWATEEKYGLVFVFPDDVADTPVPDFPGLEGVTLVVAHGAPITRTCHAHVCMVNGMDAEHLWTVHGFDLDLKPEVAESEALGTFDVSLAGPLPRTTLAERLVHALLGGRYRYSMRYHGGTLGLLTTLQDTTLLGRWPLPETRMLFAYRPTAEGTTHIEPVFVAPAGKGLGRWLAAARLRAMQRAFHVLRDDDGRIYDNIRYRPDGAPAGSALEAFHAWIDQRTPSVWSVPQGGDTATTPSGPS
ncbi:MAG: hypothetical protein RLZZ383_2883 [Pseudomonadota bacterium]|jgi:phenylpropionate dioxygenase-like ring-hydroxylating dioxygenase large terminal subunit